MINDFIGNNTFDHNNKPFYEKLIEQYCELYWKFIPYYSLTIVTKNRSCGR